jgi:hypothetical protein
MEEVERLEGRDPRDLDVVTFLPTAAHLPVDKMDSVFDHAGLMRRFNVDAYFVVLDELAPEALVENAAYWYSVWSHRRTGHWKGYLRLVLDPTDDLVARDQLAADWRGGDQA